MVIDIYRENQCWPDWPPIKPLLRSALSGRSAELGHGPASLFVKVYMEGVPIGRKLDLLSHDGYGDLSERLAHMFKTPILREYKQRNYLFSNRQQRNYLTTWIKIKYTLRSNKNRRERESVHRVNKQFLTLILFNENSCIYSFLLLDL